MDSMEKATARIPLKPSTASLLDKERRYMETWDAFLLRLLSERRSADEAFERKREQAVARVRAVQDPAQHDGNATRDPAL